MYKKYMIVNKEKHTWGEFIIGSDGFFACFTDWQNGCFHWQHFSGDSFEQWLVEMIREGSRDYFFGKMFPDLKMATVSPGMYQSVVRMILREYRSGYISREEARKEYDLAVSYLYDGDKEMVHEWCAQTDIADAWEFISYDYPQSCYSMWDQLMLPLADKIEETLLVS